MIDMPQNLPDVGQRGVKEGDDPNGQNDRTDIERIPINLDHIRMS
jgi:hypothetical protein